MSQVWRLLRDDPELPPADSPGWTPLEPAYQSLHSLTGSPPLSAKLLTDEMRKGTQGVPSLRRCFLAPYLRPQYQFGRVLDPARDIREPKFVAYHVDDPSWGIREAKIMGHHVVQWPACEWLAPTHWLNHGLSPRADGSLEVLERSGSIYVSVKGFAYFVWRPALQRIWPDIFGPPPAPEQPSPMKLAPTGPVKDPLEPAADDERRPQVAYAKELIRAVYPHSECRTMRGPKAVQQGCEGEAKERKRRALEEGTLVRPFPGVDSFARAMGRRKRKPSA